MSTEVLCLDGNSTSGISSVESTFILEILGVDFCLGINYISTESSILGDNNLDFFILRGLILLSSVPGRILISINCFNYNYIFQIYFP